MLEMLVIRRTDDLIIILTDFNKVADEVIIRRLEAGTVAEDKARDEDRPKTMPVRTAQRAVLLRLLKLRIRAPQSFKNLLALFFLRDVPSLFACSFNLPFSKTHASANPQLNPPHSAPGTVPFTVHIH